MKTPLISRRAGLLAIAVLVFAGVASQARVIRRRVPYRPPQPARPATPPPAPKPVVPKTLTASGSLMGINAGAKSLMILDDTTHATVNLVLTPQTKFVRLDQEGKPEAFKAYDHVTVSYQDTDRTVKEVRLSPPPMPGQPK